jgi:hypothetical protein
MNDKRTFLGVTSEGRVSDCVYGNIVAAAVAALNISTVLRDNKL